jgi:hypothetical protein
MQTSRRLICTLASSFILFLIPFHVAFADHDHHKSDKESHKKNAHHDDHEAHEGKYLTPVDNETYREECGACHFVYQPSLLPSGSWAKIVAGLPSHFGEEVSLNQKSKNIIDEYLRENAAENSSAKRARKILKSLKGQTPLRITETPYIQEKHHDLDANIFSRKSIGSFSNCVACHTKGDQGNYDDDFVKIPK